VNHRRRPLSVRVNYRVARSRMLLAAGVAFTATGVLPTGTLALQDGGRRP
jgi:hypothetical protein